MPLHSVGDGLNSSTDALIEFSDVLELPKKRRISPA